MANAETFPSERELETWLLGTAGETDDGAVALRSILQKNPGMHQHLTGDEVLQTLIQTQAKRFRTRIMKAENPIMPTSLYRPLCEVIWRIVALVIHSLSDFQGPGSPAEGVSAGSVAAAPFMLPKHCHGQLKMLLKTNEDLSFKFNEARRAYLRELAEHRDRQRRLGPEALQRLENLREQPVMFYEPLESILDETTKDFVREVVEERIKLEMKTDFTAMEVEDENAKRIVILEEQLQKFEEDIEALTEENKRLTSRVEREGELKRRFEEASHQWKNQAKQLQEELAKKGGEMVALPVVAEPVVPEIVEVPVVDEQQEAAAQAEIADLQQKLKDMIATLESKKSSMEDLQQKLFQANLQAEEAEKKRDMEAEKASALQAQVAKFESAAKAPKKKPDDNKAPPAPVTTGTDDAQMKAEVANAEAAKAAAEEKTKGLQKQLTDQAKKAKEEAARQANVEKELKEAKESLEKALKEAESRTRAAEKRAKQAEADRAKAQKPGDAPQAAPEPIPDPGEVEIERLEKKLKDKDKELEKLKAELQAQRSKPPPAASEEPRPVVKEKVPKPKKKEPEVDEGKMQEMTERIEGLEEDLNIANEKIKQLKKKLREHISESEMQELEMKWEAELEVPGLFRKKKAYERLWDDAQRRFFELQQRQKRLNLLQNQAVEDAAKAAHTKAAMDHAKLLASLHEASASSTSKFAESLHQFHEAHSNETTNPGPGLDAEGAQCPKCGNVYMADAKYCRKCGHKRASSTVAQDDGARRNLHKTTSGPLSPTTRERAKMELQNPLLPNGSSLQAVMVTGESMENLGRSEGATVSGLSAADEIRKATKVLVQNNPSSLAALALKEDERNRNRSADMLGAAMDFTQDGDGSKKAGRGAFGLRQDGDNSEAKDSVLGELARNQVGLHKALSKAGVPVQASRMEPSMSAQAQKPTLSEVNNALQQLVQPKNGPLPGHAEAVHQGRRSPSLSPRAEEGRAATPESGIEVKGQKIENDGKERAAADSRTELHIRQDGVPIMPTDPLFSLGVVPAPRLEEGSGPRRFLGTSTSAGGNAAVTYPAPRPHEMVNPPPPSFGLLRNPYGASGEVPGRVPLANPLPLPSKPGDLEGKARSASPSPSPRGAGGTGRWPRQKELPQKLPAMAQTTIGLSTGMGSVMQQQTWQNMAQIRSSPDLRDKEAMPLTIAALSTGADLPKELVGLGLGAANPSPTLSATEDPVRKTQAFASGGKKFSTHQATTARLVVFGSPPA